MKKNYKNIQEFINQLDKLGELIRIKDEVSPIIDISKITDVESKKSGGGKALLFENVVDNGKKTFNIATNLFGSNLRMGLALGLDDLNKAGDEIAELVETAPPKSFSDFVDLAKKALPLTRIMPKVRKSKAPCQEIVMTGDDIDLSQIPVLKCWPDDGGRFVTLPLVFTKSLDSKRRNLGMYRVQIYDKNTTGMHWHIHKDGSHFFNEYAKAKKRMPVAVAIGADPATIYAATAPMPRGIDELLLAGFFRKKGVPMTKCVTIDMEVPSEAEFVLEGYVDYDERRIEGPFGDHTGYYSLADLYPVFHLTAITRKANPIYCATLVGPPPMEDCYMAKATERIFLPLLRTVMPEVCDYFLPWEGVFHNIVIVSIDKEFPAHASKLIHGLWGQNQMSFCKAIVVVDSDTSPSDLPKIWDKFVNNFDATSDIYLSCGVLDALDHSSPTPLMGAKIGIDLTNRLGSEAPRKLSNLEVVSNKDISDFEDFLKANISEFCELSVRNNFCAISVNKAESKGRGILDKISKYEQLKRFFRSVVIFDNNVDITDNSKILWKIFNNTDPSRDIVLLDSNLSLIDACKKNKADGHNREWPDDLSFD